MTNQFYIAPMPQGELVSADYAMWVNGQPVPVYTARVSAVPFNQIWPGYQRPLDQTEIASFATFDFSGEVEITVQVLRRPIEKLELRPQEYGLQPNIRGNWVTFTLDQPRLFTFEVNGFHHALHIFANPMESFAQYQGRPGVRYFGPGVHVAGRIEMNSGDTLVLDHGAVVHGGVVAQNVKDIRIIGRGILDNSRYPREVPKEFREVSASSCMRLNHCANVEVSGIIFRDSSSWTLTAIDCRNLQLRNLKLLGMWRYNSDGIDLCNCQDAALSHSFLRTYDDGIVFKGIAYNGLNEDGSLVKGESNIERCTVTDCVFWCDWGRALELGVETYCDRVEDILFTDCHVIHSSAVSLDFSIGHRALLHRIRFEDISVETDDLGMPEVLQTEPGQVYPGRPGDGCAALFVALISRWDEWSAKNVGERGSIRDVTVKNIRVYGSKHPKSFVKGFDAEHTVEGIHFENITFNGKKAETLEEMQCELRGFCSDITIA